MDKSLGTNLHLWRFFKRAKQTVTREFIYTWSAPPLPAPPPQPTMLDTCTRYFSRVSTLYRGWGWVKQRNLKRITVLFLNSVLKPQKITQVFQGILSTIVGKNYINCGFARVYFKNIKHNCKKSSLPTLIQSVSTPILVTYSNWARATFRKICISVKNILTLTILLSCFPRF